MIGWLATFSLILEENIDLLHGAVEGNDGEAMVGGVQNEILAHNGQTNKAKISTGLRLRGGADIDAGQSRTAVSPKSLSIACATMVPADREGGWSEAAGLSSLAAAGEAADIVMLLDWNGKQTYTAESDMMILLGAKGSLFFLDTVREGDRLSWPRGLEWKSSCVSWW